MSFWSRLFGNSGATVTEEPGPGPERMWSTDAGAIPARSGSLVSPRTVLGLDVVEAVLVALTAPLSTLPLGIFRPDASGDGHKDRLREHPLARLLNKQPNPGQTAQEFRSEIFRHLALRRNAVCLIDQDFRTGDVSALTPVHPNRLLNVARSRSNGRVLYTIARLDGLGADVFDQDRVWHIRMPPLTDDGLCGRPIYETSREVFGRALAVKEYGSDWFRNSGLSGGHIVGKGTFKTKDDEAEFLREWRANSTGANRHRDKLLTGGLDYKAGPQVENNKGQFIETDRECGLALCRLWSMPPHRVGILDRATFSNVEQQALEFIMYTLAPYVAGFEQAIERDLILDGDDLVAEMNMTALLRGDTASRFKGFALGRQWGWLSVNDIRRLESMNPVANGDVYLQPMNMVDAAKADDLLDGNEDNNDDVSGQGGADSGAS